MSIQPILLADTDAPYIDEVFCVQKQFAVGDIIALPGEPRFEIEHIETARGTGPNGCDVQRLTVRYDYGGVDVLAWPITNLQRFTVVGGPKVMRANTEAGAVYKVWAGWMWREGR